MKPEEWQIREAIDSACRRPECREFFKLRLGDFLKEIGLIILDDLIQTLEDTQIEGGIH